MAAPGAVAGPAALVRDWREWSAGPDRPLPVVHHAAFGADTVELRFCGFDAATAYAGALRPARPAAAPALTITVIDGAACGLPRPRLAWQAADFGPKRQVPGWSDAGFTTYLLRSEDGLAVADWPRREAFVWLPRAAAVPWYERAAPFRWLFDQLAARSDLATLHGAVVGIDGRGVLLAGRGGSGKSTLALACLGAGFDYVGDDYCLLSLAPAPVAHALYRTAKWKRDAAVVPAWLAGGVPDAVDRAEGKNILHLDRMLPDRLAARLGLRAVVLPTIAAVATARLEPIPAQLALRHLAASTLAQAEGDGTAQVALMGRLVRSVPAFRLAMPPEPARSVAALAALLDGEPAGER